MAPSLTGIKVLDLTRALSGPFCTMLLADLGADVVKVEPLDGDMMRSWGPFDRGQSVYFLSANRNKRSLALDMRTALGKEVLLRLAMQADVLVENFRPGIMEAMGLDYAKLSRLNPRLIFCSITAFGPEGPLSGSPGFDQIAQGLSGLMSVTGHSETGSTRVGVPIGDLVSGIYGALGISAALVQRAQTGMGNQVETSLLGGLISLLSVQGQRYLSLGEIPGPAGNDHPSICPYGVYEAQDGPFNLAAATVGMWKSLCQVLGAEEWLDDPRFRDQQSRYAHRSELKVLLNERFQGQTRAVWMEELDRAGIPCGVIARIDEVFANPQTAALGMIVDLLDPVRGPTRVVGNPVKFGAEGDVVPCLPPELGAHSEEILAEYGFTSAEVAALVTAGVMRSREV